VKFLGILIINNGRIEVSAAAEPTFGGGQETCVHVHSGHMRIRHVRDKTDAGGKETGVFGCAMNGLRKIGVERTAHGRDVDAYFLEYLTLHHPAHPAAAGRAIMVSPVPSEIIE